MFGGKKEKAFAPPVAGPLPKMQGGSPTVAHEPSAKASWKPVRHTKGTSPRSSSAERRRSGGAADVLERGKSPKRHGDGSLEARLEDVPGSSIFIYPPGLGFRSKPPVSPSTQLEDPTEGRSSIPIPVDSFDEYLEPQDDPNFPVMERPKAPVLGGLSQSAILQEVYRRLEQHVQAFLPSIMEESIISLLSTEGTSDTPTEADSSTEHPSGMSVEGELGKSLPRPVPLAADDDKSSARAGTAHRGSKTQLPHHWHFALTKFLEEKYPDLCPESQTLGPGPIQSPYSKAASPPYFMRVSPSMGLPSSSSGTPSSSTFPASSSLPRHQGSRTYAVPRANRSYSFTSMHSTNGSEELDKELDTLNIGDYLPLDPRAQEPGRPPAPVPDADTGRRGPRDRKRVKDKRMPSKHPGSPARLPATAAQTWKLPLFGDSAPPDLEEAQSTTSTVSSSEVIRPTKMPPATSSGSSTDSEPITSPLQTLQESIKSPRSAFSEPSTPRERMERDKEKEKEKEKEKKKGGTILRKRRKKSKS